MTTTPSFSEFLRQHVEAFVDDFERFARQSGPSARHLSSAELRDHAKLLLLAIADDMATPQSESARQDKAEAADVAAPFSRITATSQMHAQHRFEQGFTLTQMVSEYRAMRASVIRHWTAQLEAFGTEPLQQLTRFGEAVDEGLTVAIAWYSKHLEDSRNLLIGVLAHDLRSPVGAVRMSAEYLLRMDELPDTARRAASRIASSSIRIAGYVQDLLDFAQTLLGAGLPIVRARVNLAALCEDVVDELRAAYPAAQIKLRLLGRSKGAWDAARLSQALSNLTVNAIIHGDAERPVTVSFAPGADQVAIEVHNEGPPIPEQDLAMLFQPLMQVRPADDGGSSGLGLGLYIANEIAVAHGGRIAVSSSAEAGTSFKLLLPLA